MSGLQKVVNILPPSADAAGMDLLIEAGRYGLSCLWHSEEGQRAEGVLIYYGTGRTDDESLAADIRRIFESEPLLNQGYRSVQVFHNFAESLVFPKKYFSPDHSDASLSLLFGETENAIRYEREIPGTDMICSYRVPEPLDAFFNSYLFSYRPSHPFAELLRKNNFDGNSIHCSIYPGCFRTLVRVKGQLQLAAVHEYSSPEDIAYTLLNICYQHTVKPDDMNLLLDGMIDNRSNLSLELTKYFLKTDFARHAGNISMTKALSEYPSHYFHNLIELAACGS